MASLRSRLREGRVALISRGTERAFSKFPSIPVDKVIDQTRITSAFAEFWKEYYTPE